MSRHSRQHENHPDRISCDRFGHPFSEDDGALPQSPYKIRMRRKFSEKPEHYDKGDNLESDSIANG